MKIWKLVYVQVIQQVHNTSQLPQPYLYIKNPLLNYGSHFIGGEKTLKLK
jgi:hypothetical protein